MTMHTSAMKLSSTKWRNRFRLNTVHRWFVLFSLHLLLIIWFIQCFTSDLAFFSFTFVQSAFVSLLFFSQCLPYSTKMFSLYFDIISQCEVFFVYMYTHKYYICLNNTLTLCVALTVNTQKWEKERERRRLRKRRKRSTKWEKRRRRRRRRIEIRRHVAEKNGTNCVISNYLLGCCCYCCYCYCYSFVYMFGGSFVRLFVCFGFFFSWLKLVKTKCVSIPKVIKSSISQQMSIIYS